MKITNAEGSDCTKVGFFHERLDRGADSDLKDIDGENTRTTNNVADSRRKMTVGGGEATPQGAEPVVDLRATANTRGMPAILAITLKKRLLLLGLNGIRDEDEA